MPSVCTAACSSASPADAPSYGERGVRVRLRAVSGESAYGSVMGWREDRIGSALRGENPTVVSFVTVFVVVYVLINLVVDLIYGLLDPRIRYVTT